MHDQLKKLPAAFYQLPNGSEPVRDWLKSLPADDRKVVGTDIAAIEYGWPVGMPLCRPLGNSLWEVRSPLPSRRIARVIFCVANRKMVLLHGFIKKTERTPKSDLDLAKKRRMEIQSHEEKKER
jgi:phage-related protein